ncbi:unnamed protein product [Phaedon cochleariae]|uniref:Sugar transporter n=1 Tax=Phaedon cochleariae TaxID=80249 RepID=A0A9N9SM17_PHACE|nr:unnamed protein product [Phaedon cochleariae]
MEMGKIADSKEVIYIPSGNISDNQQELIRDDEHKRRETLFLHLSAFTACMVLFAGTTDMVWTSPVIPKLKSNDSDINPLGQPITAYQISLIAGLPALTLVVGGLAFAKLPNLIGRKRAIMCMAAGMLASNIAVACGGHVYVYYVGRSAFSLFRGAASIAVPIYLSEICEDCNRVKFGCLMGLANPAGNLFGYLVGPVTSVRVFTLLCVAPLVPSLLFFSTVVPESPVYLASVKDRVGSIRALGKLRMYKEPEEIERDYKRIEEALEARAGVKTSGFLSLFKTRAVRRGLLIGVGLKLAQNFAGVVVIMSFLGPMFNDAGTRLSGNSVAILVGIVKIITFLVTSFTVEKVIRSSIEQSNIEARSNDSRMPIEHESNSYDVRSLKSEWDDRAAYS